MSMNPSRFLRTPTLEIVLQATDAEASGGGRAWEIHDVERNRGFRVKITPESLKTVPGGRKALGRAFSDAEVDAAIGLAIERALVTPPEKIGGNVYDVDVTPDDLYAAVDLGA